MSEPDSADIKQFLAELRDFNKEKRRTAVMKLGMAGGDQAVTALILAVQNRNEDLIVRGRAALMLGQIGDTRAVMPLIKALEASDQFDSRYQFKHLSIQEAGAKRRRPARNGPPGPLID